MSEVADPRLEAIEKIAKSLIWDNAVEAFLAAVFANPYTSWLNVPPLRWIFAGLVGMFTDALWKLFKLTLDVGYIRLRNAEAQRKYESASVRLKIIALENGANSEEFKKANEDDKKALAEFIRFGGSRAA